MSYVDMEASEIRRPSMQILPFLIHPGSFAQIAARQIIIAHTTTCNTVHIEASLPLGRKMVK
jgi:hypothetical protein